MGLKDRLKKLEGTQQDIQLIDDSNNNIYTVPMKAVFQMLPAARKVIVCRLEGGDEDALEHPPEIADLVHLLDRGLQERYPYKDGQLTRAASLWLQGHRDYEEGPGDHTT